jgi:hypothetical protein
MHDEMGLRWILDRSASRPMPVGDGPTSVQVGANHCKEFAPEA